MYRPAWLDQNAAFYVMLSISFCILYIYVTNIHLAVCKTQQKQRRKITGKSREREKTGESRETGETE